jgi:hypothetical protein
MENSDWLGVIFFMVLVFGIGFGINGCVEHENTPEYKAMQAARLKKCETPELVSEVDGIKLFVVQPNCGRNVYFSKSGTHTTHTERRGKTTSTYDDDVSAGGGQ